MIPILCCFFANDWCFWHLKKCSGFWRKYYRYLEYRETPNSLWYTCQCSLSRCGEREHNPNTQRAGGLYVRPDGVGTDYSSGICVEARLQGIWADNFWYNNGSSFYFQICWNCLFLFTYKNSVTEQNRPMHFLHNIQMYFLLLGTCALGMHRL